MFCSSYQDILNIFQSQMEANAMRGEAASPLLQGQGQLPNTKIMGQGHGKQMAKKGPGNKNRECDFDDKNLLVNVNLNQTATKSHKRQHVTTTPPPHSYIYVEQTPSTQAYHGQYEHMNPAAVHHGHQGHHEHHVISTPVHHGHRQVKGQQHAQHFHQQVYGKQGQGHALHHQHSQDQGSATKSQGRRQRKKKVLFTLFMLKKN